MLIATDLDGTFLSPDGTVSPRNRAAVEAAEGAGVHVIPVSGRALRGLELVCGGLMRYALVSNGALGFDLDEGAVLFSQVTPADLVAHFVDVLSRALPGVVFCSIVGDASTFLVEDGWEELDSAYEAANDPAEHVAVSREELCGRDCVKLMARHPDVPAADMFGLARDLGMSGAHVTWAGFSMIEMSRSGVSKDSGLELMCRHLGERREDVVALGDGANDVEMLNWAGTSYAMAGAVDEAVAAADRRAPSNAEDGFAQVVEEVLASM